LKRPASVLCIVAVAVSLVAALVLVSRWAYPISGRPSGEPELGSWYVDVERYNQGVHGGLECSICHTEISTGQHPNQENLTNSATELFAYEACASCHPQEYEYYQRGVHAEVLSGARPSESEYPAPTCGHCHDPHYRQVLSRLQVIDAQVNICGQCHPSELESYLENYHGKTAVDLDFADSASCADCHGSHQVVALDQPQEELQACRRCHPGANENMAGFLIHAEKTLSPQPDQPHSREFVLLFLVQGFFVVLTASVLAFFYGHTFLWLLRGLHEKLRRQ
jgi:hypothetical protein